MNSAEVIHFRKNFLIHCLYKATPIGLFLSLVMPGVLAGTPVAANPVPSQSSSQRDQDGGRDDDFLFSAPKGFIGFRLGKFFPRANSDLFDLITDELTL
jgi:hypothetical protein